MSTDVVVLTGAAGRLIGLAGALASPGVEVRDRPLIRFDAPASWALVDQAIDSLARHGVVALTSPRAALAFGERVLTRGGPLAAVEVWAVGNTTAVAWPAGLGPAHLPSDGADSEGGAARLAKAMLAAGVNGTVLFPCGDLRKPELPQLLRVAGVNVIEVICYHTRLADEATTRGALQGASLVVVTSPSVAQLLCRAAAKADRPRLIAIGPTTASTLDLAGWPPVATARAPTTDAVLEALRSQLRSANLR